MSVIKVYDQYKIYVRHISSGREYKNLKIVHTHADGDEQLSMLWLDECVPHYMEPEGYLETQDQWYVIKENNGKEIIAQLDLEEMESVSIDSFSAANKTLQEAGEMALQDTGWTISTLITKTRSVQTFRHTPLEIIRKMRDAWMCEIRFDTKTKTILFSDEIGTDRGVYFIDGVNLISASRTVDSYDFATRIYPIGKDGMTIAEVNGGETYIENLMYSSKAKAVVWEDSSYEDAKTLMKDAIKKLADISKPKVSYTATVKDLAALKKNTNSEPFEDEEGKELVDEVGVLLYEGAIYSAFEFESGDTVRLVSEINGIRDKQRIVKITSYPDDPGKTELELANTVPTWEDMQAKIKAMQDAWKEMRNADGSLSGVYVHGIKGESLVEIEVRYNNRIAELEKKIGG